MNPASIPELPFATLAMIYLVVVVISALINGLIIQYAASYMNIIDADFGKCFLTALFIAITQAVISLFTGGGSAVPGPISWVISAVVGTILIKFMLNTEWGTAFLVWIITIIITFLLTCALIMVCVTGACMCVPFANP